MFRCTTCTSHTPPRHTDGVYGMNMCSEASTINFSLSLTNPSIRLQLNDRISWLFGAVDGNIMSCCVSGPPIMSKRIFLLFMDIWVDESTSSRSMSSVLILFEYPMCGGSWLDEAMKVPRHACPILTKSANVSCVARTMSGEITDGTSPFYNRSPLVRPMSQPLGEIITCMVCILSAKVPLSTDVSCTSVWKKWWVKTEELVMKIVKIVDDDDWIMWMDHIWMM